MSIARAFPALLLALSGASALADTTDYSFAGSYNTVWAGSFVQLPYTGSFTVTDPAATNLRPPSAPDVTLPAYAGIWAGTSVFYTGATNLQITFANGATLSAPALDTVVNNTTLSEGGAPYPLGLSAQLYTRGAVVAGMTARQVCPDGSVDDACDDFADDHGIDPPYTQGDAADLAVQQMTGVYFAFYSAPLSTVAAGVPDFASAFGGAGLGIYAVNQLGQPTTTLTSFSQISGVTSPSPVPEPGTWLLWAGGLALPLLGRRQRQRRAAR